VALAHGRGTVHGTLVARLSINGGQVFSCLTGDRDSRPNAGEERSLLGGQYRSDARATGSQLEHKIVGIFGFGNPVTGCRGHVDARVVAGEKLVGDLLERLRAESDSSAPEVFMSGCSTMLRPQSSALSRAGALSELPLDRALDGLPGAWLRSNNSEYSESRT
jgi:hypothetical protein